MAHWGPGITRMERWMEQIEKEEPDLYAELLELRRYDPQGFRKALRRRFPQIDGRRLRSQRIPPGGGSDAPQPPSPSLTREIGPPELPEVEGVAAPPAAQKPTAEVPRAMGRMRVKTEQLPDPAARPVGHPALAGSGAAAVSAIASGAWDHEIEALLAEESAGKKRVTVLRALRARNTGA